MTNEDIFQILARKKYRHWMRFVLSENEDKRQTMEIINVIAGLFSTEELENLDENLGKYMHDNQTLLDHIYFNYKDDKRESNFLMWLPSALLILLAAEKDRFMLRAVWEQNFPIEPLEQFGSVFGLVL